MPDSPPTPAVIQEAITLAKVRALILADGDWITSSQIAEIAGYSAANVNAQPSKWITHSKIFTIRHQNTEYFPTYGLDPKRQYKPREILASIIKIFKDTKDGWGMAYWFASANSLLGGKRPKDLLDLTPEQVLAAAQDEHNGVQHC